TLSCSSDISRNSSPVNLVVTNVPNIFRIDLAGNTAGSTACGQDLGAINIEARLKHPSNTSQQFNDVRITRYRVSYQRTDGGTAVPAPFVISMDQLVTANGGVTALSKFVVLRSEAMVQAPFASLIPGNGGRDPETGRSRVDMDVIVEVFGQTLAGTSVSGATRFPLEFCYNCGGCA
ncbi:MAG TPA: hypothetical protein VLU46_07730, partial [Thermoanaerobaculia bacterium]|nr:hypothetical protein [Thermoanaerobaculia bacterium]